MSKRGYRSRPFPRVSASRRKFLQLSSAAMTGVILTNCARNIGTSDSSGTDGSASADAASGDNNTLHIYTWADYIDDQLLADFEKETGIRVIADIYDSNETMLAKMQAGGGAQYSVIYPSDYMVEQMLEMDMLMEMDPTKLPDMADLFPQWQSPPYDADNKHSFPYAWGTTGLIVNAAKLDGKLTDWDYLWENKQELSRKMTLLNDVREVAGVALKMLGYSNSTQDPDEIEEAFEMLKELKPHLSAFTTDGWRDRIIPGDLLVAHAYSVDAFSVTDENPDLQYVVPESGATVWTDAVVIPKTAPNPEAAYAWMNYVLMPETSSDVVSRLGLATANKITFDGLPDELKEDPRVFPPEDVLAKCQALANVGDSIELYDRLWTELTST